ncbi:KR-domain-containing protein [Aspergillus transmontanensis]|uniref:KR-domain-containing protein n=1 Tax=Aspergillus transmontanensis TaxID=1034304 RepID=A0A5N6WBD1_9EURO|nr:KR-domain-containing protein [Aspergillus transmontanensis]
MPNSQHWMSSRTVGLAADTAINAVLEDSKQERSKVLVEAEFAERNGILHVDRVVPDEPINKLKRDVRQGAEPVLRDLHHAHAAVSLRAELHEGRIEVKVVATGVIYKDVAVTMGIVPENEYTLGYEGPGVVMRLGSGVAKFKVGDRVCFLHSGSYASRLQVPVERAMSFQTRWPLSGNYSFGLFGFDILIVPYCQRERRPGRDHPRRVDPSKRLLTSKQPVLIHTASGELGISTIQLAQHRNAEAEEKRQFLADNYGIPRDHMFSSRNTDFAQAILKATQGRGVDIILNTLPGEILDESWRICADGGTFVELGKKDIVDRKLSMEPFDRNCSFRAMDFSYMKNISDPLIALRIELLDEIFDLVNTGHIKPVQPITTFNLDNIQSALALIRSGRHVGKVVISDGESPCVLVPIRPAPSKVALRSDASYLIVSGLKGLCGNLAIHMARQGARQIIVCSRSGLSDDASQKTVANCSAYGCDIVEAKGDVADMAFLRKCSVRQLLQIAGVVQGAMILGDKSYEVMTLDEYRTALYGKFHGTWALHHVSMEQQQPLEFFTMLSSISGIGGKKGQSNYSAANTFLDAFAAYRQSLGLRANSVNLGLIEDVGYIAEQGGMHSHFDERVWTPLYEGNLRQILDLSILQQTTSPINPSSSAQLVPGLGFPLPDNSDLIREARSDTSSGGLQQACRVAAVEPMATQFTKILQLEAEMEPAKSMMAYGLDSLAAVELRNWVRSELGAELTTLDITNASPLIALCERLVSKLSSPEAA